MDLESELLERLDGSWSSGAPANLKELVGIARPHSIRLVQELCAADLEWRWRTIADPSGPSPVARAEDYAQLLGERWESMECRRDLLEAEWCARCIWGDAPDIDDFALRLKAATDWTGVLGTKLNALVPWQVTLVGPSLRRPVSMPTPWLFEIGRQGVGEPTAPAWVEESSRLVVANSHFRTISRAQLRIRRTRYREAEVTNLSRVSPFAVQEEVLATDQSIRCALPFSATVGALEIQVKLTDEA